MLYTTFSSYDSATDAVAGKSSWIVNDHNLQQISQAVLSRKAVTIRSTSREGGHLAFEWLRELEAFHCIAGGKSSGLVFLDELKGAIGKRIPTKALPVQVCLNGDLDIYRKGILDPLSGMISVYTATMNLAPYGATAYLLDDQLEGGRGRLILGLARGEPSIQALHVSSDSLSLLQARLAEAERPITDLRSSANQPAPIPEGTAHHDPSKALRQILQTLQEHTVPPLIVKAMKPRQ